MSNYLILTDSEVCPACHYRSNPRHNRDCLICGFRLFLRPIAFQKYEDDGNLRNYWMFSGRDRGWLSRDFIMAKESPPAQIRDEKIVTPPPNNSTTPKAVARRGGRLKKSQLPTNPFVSAK